MTNQISAPVWLEVALNGGTGQQHQPNIPIRPDDIIDEAVACADAGVAIIHLHAYDEDGRGVEDADIYARIIEGIRARCDAIVYPTLALGGDIEERLAPVRILAERGLLEWGVVDPGSVNITHRSRIAAGKGGLVYGNPDEHIQAALALAEQSGWRPAYAIYEPGFARSGAAWAAQFPKLKTPVYRFMLSDHLLFGLAPSEAAVDFYAWHLNEVAPGAPWMMSGLDANTAPLIECALAKGAHIRVGLEDAPLGCHQSNIALVEDALVKIARSSRPLATPAEIRAYD